MIRSIRFSRYVGIVNESPGIGGASWNYISAAIGRCDCKGTPRTESLSNRLYKRFGIYLNTNLKFLAETIASRPRSRRNGIDNCLYCVGGIGERLANVSLKVSFFSFSSN